MSASSQLVTVTPWHFVALVALLVGSALASMSETVMMAANRLRLQALAAHGNRSAHFATVLLADTDRLLGVILLLNNVINVGAATLASVITLALFGEHESALAVGSFVLTFVILVFSEITPKAIGARYADTLVLWFAWPLTVLLKLTGPIVDFVNLFVKGLLTLLRLNRRRDLNSYSLEELRMLLRQTSVWRFQNHRELLLNLLDIEHLTVADVMKPRRAIESLDLSENENALREQLATAYHTRLPLIDSRSDEILGIVHARQILSALLQDQPFSRELLKKRATPAYFIPAKTPVLTQLNEFQKRQQRLALVVDEYGELLGLVTIDDIVEEIVGQFTTSLSGSHPIQWDEQGRVTLPGETLIRDINRALGIRLPEDRGRTLNGLLLATLQALPDGETAVRFDEVVVEIVQTDSRTVRVARLRRVSEERSE
ncbi:HlyC/CorC family transporter [Hydrogenophilus thiooxidans]|uniref:HlyC/CorC family transporter n=1 Tax=Hydrogenophilus thiooxidans TaxID=2820326 RepID=UPI001C2473A0|nr:CNNM domain-containing protein [Hydrogenophilus thiooxidans]